MTYVVGFSRKDINFIVCDTRLTWMHPGGADSYDIAVKSGVLFPGCLFARAGDAQNSSRFIASAKEQLPPQGSPEDLWRHFTHFIDEYPFPERGHFSILLSSRANGSARFYVLDPRTGLVRAREKRPSLGSGKKLLDPIIKQEIVEADSFLARIASEYSDTVSIDVLAYRVCQNLTLYAQSLGRSKMESCGVGGVFHFLAQSGHREYRQRPSLYIAIMVSNAGKSIYLWMYRIAPVHGGLVVETHIPPRQLKEHPTRGHLNRDFYLDAVLASELNDVVVSDEASEHFRDHLFGQLKETEFYHYCGWGFINQEHHDSYGFQLMSEGAQPLVTSGGVVHEQLAANILAQIQSKTDIEGFITMYWSTNSDGRALQTEL